MSQGINSAKKKGHTTLLKLTAALRMLAYNSSADGLDENLRISKQSVLNATKEFSSAIVQEFGDLYLRNPDAADIIKIYKYNAKKGFPGLLGSLDCTHFRWKNCPKGYHGHYQGKDNVATIILEAVATDDLWIWHAFVGMPGACNDLNVLAMSNLLDRFININNPVNHVVYELNEKQQRIGYFLTDGIYPRSPIFMKPIQNPTTMIERHYTAKQESMRKGIERAFGSLKKRFNILNELILHSKKEFTCIILCCIILHNMRLEFDGVAINPTPMGNSSMQEIGAISHNEQIIVYTRSNITRLIKG